MTGHPADGEGPQRPASPLSLAVVLIAYGVVILGVAVGTLVLFQWLLS